MNYRFMKLRRVALVALSVVCTLSTTTAICANAVSEKYTHTVSVNSGTGSDDAEWISMKQAAKVTDEFAGYPTIYNSSSSTNKSRAEHGTTGTKTAYKSFTLYDGRSAPVSVDYGKLNYTGSWRLYYYHVSVGGFRDSVTTIKWY